MNKKLLRKIGLDAVMTVLLVVLMIYALTGALWHEILGLGILSLVLIHLAFNGRWIAAMTRRLFTSKLTINTIRYLCDGLLLVLVPFTAISGVLISRSLLTSISASNEMLWIVLHHWTAYLSLIVVSVHIGLHWKMIMVFFAKRFPAGKFKTLRSAACKLISVAVMLYGLKASIQYELPSLNTDDDQSDANAAVSSDSAVIQQNSVIYLSADGKDVPSVRSTYDAPSDGDTLQDYLGRLVCSGCHRRCSLLSPQCSRGQSQAAQAESAYETWQSAQAQSDDTDDETQSSEGSQQSDETQDSDILNLDDEDTAVTAELGDEPIELAQITPIMGMYIAGTYYILEFVSARKRKGGKE